jgi:hypothetical protein
MVLVQPCNALLLLARIKAMGINRRAVHNYLLRARTILRQTFNADGRLFRHR